MLVFHKSYLGRSLGLVLIGWDSQEEHKLVNVGAEGLGQDHRGDAGQFLQFQAHFFL